MKIKTRSSRNKIIAPLNGSLPCIWLSLRKRVLSEVSPAKNGTMVAFKLLEDTSKYSSLFILNQSPNAGNKNNEILSINHKKLIYCKIHTTDKEVTLHAIATQGQPSERSQSSQRCKSFAIKVVCRNV